jgi:hypothetical protein
LLLLQTADMFKIRYLLIEIWRLDDGLAVGVVQVDGFFCCLRAMMQYTSVLLC